MLNARTPPRRPAGLVEKAPENHDNKPDNVFTDDASPKPTITAAMKPRATPKTTGCRTIAAIPVDTDDTQSSPTDRAKRLEERVALLLNRQKDTKGETSTKRALKNQTTLDRQTDKSDETVVSQKENTIVVHATLRRSRSPTSNDISLCFTVISKNC